MNEIIKKMIEEKYPEIVRVNGKITQYDNGYLQRIESAQFGFALADAVGFAEWCADNQKYVRVSIPDKNMNIWIDQDTPETEPSQHGHDDYYFAYGLSPRGIMHQVIYKNGILFHDPHPSHDGLVEIKGYEVLKPLSLTK